MKRILILVVSLTMLLTACGGQVASPTPTVGPTQPPVATAAVTVTASPQPSEFKLDPDTACQTVSAKPDPIPGILPITSDDWVKGAKDAPVTLIEYGDYQ